MEAVCEGQMSPRLRQHLVRQRRRLQRAANAKRHQAARRAWDRGQAGDVGRLFSEYDEPRPHAVLSVIDQSMSRPRVAALRLVVNAAAVRVVRRERRVDNANAGGGNEKAISAASRAKALAKGGRGRLSRCVRAAAEQLSPACIWGSLALGQSIRRAGGLHCMKVGPYRGRPFKQFPGTSPLISCFQFT